MFGENRGENKKRRLDFIRKLLCMCFVVCAAACVEALVLPAKAAPASLKAQSAVVYENADEESSPVGNLVQEGAFEYVGDVTAEDGSTWRQVIIAGGVTGYIKGNVEMELTGGGQENQEGQEPPAEDGRDAPPGEAEGEDGREEAGGTPGEEAGAPDGEEALAGEAGEGEDTPGAGVPETDGGILTVQDIQNHRSKNYSSNTAGRIKMKEGSAGDMTDSLDESISMDAADIKNIKRGFNIDTALLLGLAAVAACVFTTYVFWKKIERMKLGAENEEYLSHIERGFSRKNEKRKYSPHGKAKKKRPKAKKGNGKG